MVSHVRHMTNYFRPKICPNNRAHTVFDECLILSAHFNIQQCHERNGSVRFVAVLLHPVWNRSWPVFGILTLNRDELGRQRVF